MTRAPLNGPEILSKVDFSEEPPAGISQPALDFVRRFFQAAHATPEIVGTAAIWSDGTWALLTYDPAWGQPVPQQLLWAYRSAFAAGIRLPTGTPSGNFS